MALPASDNFNRANGTLSTGNWAKTSDLDDLKILSNAVTKTTSDGGDYWNADTFNANHWSECKIPTADDGGPAVRCSSSGCYYLTCTSGTNNSAVYRYKTGGNWSQVGTSFTMTLSAGDVLRLEATGTTTTTLKVYQNGTLKKTVTDSSSPLTSGKAGVYCAVTTVVDDWQGGDVASGTTYTDTGSDTSTHQASGAAPVIRVSTGADTSTRQASGRSALTHADTIAAVQSKQASAVDKLVQRQTGAAQSSHQVSGADVMRHIYIDVGAGQQSKQASATGALINVMTGAAWSSKQASGADVSIGVEAGAVTSAHAASAVSGQVYPETGQAQTPHVSIGQDVIVTSDTGAAVMPGVASGADVTAHIYEDAGAAEHPKDASGIDALLATDSANAEAPHVAAGEDVYIQRGAQVETGDVQAPLSASGADSVATSDTGASVTPLYASGDDYLINAAVGAVETPLSTSGADVYIHYETQTYTETGISGLTAQAGGADVYARGYIEAGSVESPRDTSGADVLLNVATGAAVAPFGASGVDSVVNVTTGGATSTRAGSVADEFFHALTYIETGVGQMPHSGSGADVYTKTGGGGHGDAFPLNAEYRGVGLEDEWLGRVNDDEEVLIAYALL